MSKPLSFSEFVSSSVSLNESLNTPQFFEYSDDTTPPKTFYIFFDVGNTKYGASLVESQYSKVYRLSVYRIVNTYRKLWSFKNPSHVRPVISTIIDFLEKSLPYVYARMDALILDVTEKSDIAKYQSLFKRIIRVNPKLKKYVVKDVAKTSEKKNDNFMFMVKNGMEATDIFKSAAFKKHYSFVANQDGAVNADILGNVAPKKVEKPIVSLVPSTKFIFNTIEVEYDLQKDDKPIQKIVAAKEKYRSETKTSGEKVKSGKLKDFEVGDEVIIADDTMAAFNGRKVKILKKVSSGIVQIQFMDKGSTQLISSNIDVIVVDSNKPKVNTNKEEFGTLDSYDVGDVVTFDDDKAYLIKGRVAKIVKKGLGTVTVKYLEDGKISELAGKLKVLFGDHSIKEPVHNSNTPTKNRAIDELKVGDLVRVDDPSSLFHDKAFKIVDSGQPNSLGFRSKSNNEVLIVSLNVADEAMNALARVKKFSIKGKEDDVFKEFLKNPKSKNNETNIVVAFAAAFLRKVAYTRYNESDKPTLKIVYDAFIENRENFKRDLMQNAMETLENIIVQVDMTQIATHKVGWKPLQKELSSNKESRESFYDVISSIRFSTILAANSLNLSSDFEILSVEKIELDSDPISTVPEFEGANLSNAYDGSLGFEEYGPPPENVDKKELYLKTKDRTVRKWYKGFGTHRNSGDTLLRDGANALKDYTGSYAYDMNREMREIFRDFKDDSNVPESIMGHSLSLMRYFDQEAPRLEKGIWVYRNVRNHPDKDSFSVKDDFIDPGFLSTTISSKMSLGKGEIRLKIYLPAGTKCFPILDESNHSSESEIVLPPLSILMITKIIKRKDKYSSNSTMMMECIYTGTGMKSFLSKVEKKLEKNAVPTRDFVKEGFKPFPDGFDVRGLEEGDQYIVNGGKHAGKVVKVIEVAGGWVTLKLVDDESEPKYSFNKVTPYDSNVFDNIMSGTIAGNFSPILVKKASSVPVQKIENHESKGFKHIPEGFKFDQMEKGDQYVVNGGPGDGMVVTVLNNSKPGQMLTVKGNGDKVTIYYDPDAKPFGAYGEVEAGKEYPVWMKFIAIEMKNKGFMKASIGVSFEAMIKGDEYIINGGPNDGKIVTVLLNDTEEKYLIVKMKDESATKLDYGNKDGFWTKNSSIVGVNKPVWIKQSNSAYSNAVDLYYGDEIGDIQKKQKKLSGKDYKKMGFKMYTGIGGFKFENMIVGDQYVINGGSMDGKIATVNHVSFVTSSIDVRVDEVPHIIYFNDPFIKPAAGTSYPILFKRVNE